MSNGGHQLALVSVIAALFGVAFIWVTVHILRTEPELRVLVLWLLSLVASVTSATVAVLVYVRNPKKRGSAHRVDTLVSAVEHSRRIYSVD